MLWFGLAHAVALKHLEQLVVAGLEFRQVRSLRRLWHAAGNRVDAAAEVPAVRADAELISCFVALPYIAADGAQLGDEARFGALAVVEQAQHTAVPAVRLRPPEREPQVTIARMADERGPQVRPVAAVLGVLPPLQDRARGGVLGLWECAHAAYRFQGLTLAAAGAAAWACGLTPAGSNPVTSARAG